MPNIEVRSAARSFAVRLALFYAAIFTILGTALPYLPIWLHYRGLTAVEIGLVGSVPMFIRIVATPVIGFLADRYASRRGTVIVGAWLALVSVVLLNWAQGFWPILILVALMQLAAMSLMPIVEAIAFTGARRYNIVYGHMRLGGSLSFIAANIIGGWVVALYTGASIIFMIIASVAATVVAAHALPQPPDRAKTAPPDTEQPRPQLMRFSDVWRLVTAPWFVLLLVGSGAIQASHAVYYTFASLHWRSLGISESWIGVLWALGVVAEVVLFAVSGPIVRRLGPYVLMLVGGMAGLVRWTLMALDPPFVALFALQLLHALTFGATHLGVVHAIQLSVPEHQTGSAQAMNSAVGSGIAMGLATLCSGVVYEAYGGASYAFMSIVALTGLLATVALIAISRHD